MNKIANQVERLKEVSKGLLFLGFVVMPVKKDKRPVLTKWTADDFTVDEETLNTHFDKGEQLGIVTGKRSGITVIDIDFITDGVFGTDPNIFPETYTVRTPSGALQKYYEYCADIAQSQKGIEKYPCVDIRNDGGQVVSPPSLMEYTKTYSNGEVKEIKAGYTVVKGKITELSPFPIELFTKYTKQEKKEIQPFENKGRPGDEFESTVSWEQILAPFGWKSSYTDKTGSLHWTRPNKKGEATSATTRLVDGRERLFVFSTNSEFESYDAGKQNSYTKLTAYAKLNHNGDFNSAIYSLREQGYGIKTVEEKPIVGGARFTSLSCLMEKDFPPCHFALEPFFETNAINMISAPPNHWKSWSLLDMALDISVGTKWLDVFKTEKQKVLIVNEEDTEQAVQQRMKLLSAVDRGTDVFFLVMTGYKLTKENAVDIILECKKNDITLVMFDSLRSIHNANENDSTAMQEVMDNLKMFIREKITVVFTHHHKKKPQKDAGSIDDAETTRGSTAINAAVSGHISLEEEKREEETFVVIKHLKSKATGKLAPFDVKIKIDLNKSVEFEYADAHIPDFIASQKATNEILKILELEKDRWFTVADLCGKSSYSEKNVRSALRNLTDKSFAHVSTRKDLGERIAGKGGGSAKLYMYRSLEDQNDLSLDDW